MGQPFVAIFPAASATAVAALQTLAGAGALTLNGSLSNISLLPPGIVQVSFPNIQRVVTLTSTGDLSGINFTIVGKTVQGVAVSETRVGPNNNTVATTAQYQSVSSITSDAAVATAVSAGSGTVGATAWMLPDQITNPTDISIFIVATATVSYTVQYTPDNPNVTVSPALFDDLNLAAATVSGSTSLGAPCGGVRAKVNSSSGSGAITLTVSQARP